MGTLYHVRNYRFPHPADRAELVLTGKDALLYEVLEQLHTAAIGLADGPEDMTFKTGPIDFNLPELAPLKQQLKNSYKVDLEQYLKQRGLTNYEHVSDLYLDVVAHEGLTPSQYWRKIETFFDAPKDVFTELTGVQDGNGELKHVQLSKLNVIG